MRERLTAFLQYPSFPDEQKTRHAELLNLILLYSALLSALGLFFGPSVATTLGLLAFIASSLILQQLLKRGWVDQVGWIHISLMWLILSYLALEAGQVNSLAAAGFTLVVLVAALVLGRAGAHLFLILSITATGMLAFLQATGVVQPSPVNPTTAWLGAIVLLVSLWLVISYALKLISSLIEDARHEALQRQKIDEQVLRQSRYLSALHETTLSLVNQLDLNTLLQLILTEAAELLDAHDGYLDLIRPEDQAAVQEVGIGVYASQVGRRSAPPSGLTRRVLKSGQPVVVEEHTAGQEVAAGLQEPVPTALLSVPLRLGDQIVGVLGLAHMEPGRTFSSEQAGLLSQFAELASLAYHNASLYEHAQLELAERKRAEQTLAASDKRLQLVMEGAELGTWDWDLQTDKLRYDEQWERMLGYSRGQARPDLEWWADAIHPEDRLHVMRALKNNIDGLSPAFDLEVRLCDASGQWRWLLLRGQVTSQDAEGHPLIVSGTQIDISRRVEMEQAIREANRTLDGYSRELEHRTRLLVAAAEISRTATGILDRDSLGQLAVDLIVAEFGLYYAGLFLLEEGTNRAALHAGTGEAGRRMLEERHVLEISDDSPVGWSIAHAEGRIAPHMGEQAARFENPLLPLTRSELALPLVSRGTVLGALTIQSTQEAAFSDEDIAVFQTMADQLANAIANAGLYDQLQKELAQRRRVEIEIRRLNAELEERVRQRTAALEDANREMESFAYSVSHDLRAPLRSVSSYSRILSKDHSRALNPDALHMLDRIVDSARYMSELIDDLLRLSRVSRQDLSLSNVNLSALAQVSIEELQHHHPEHAPSVEVEEDLFVQGDERLLRLAIANLLGNAWKFTSKTPGAWIRFGAEVHNGESVYYVRDNGVGFDMKYAGKLFAAFQRLHTQDEFPGMGVGLAIVQRVIHRHGGRVWAEGKRGEGACFYFTLS